MADILNYLVYKPFSWILLSLYQLTGSYGLAILLFCLVIKILFFPISMKSKKGMMQQNRLQPKLADIQKRYKDDKQKQQQAIAKLYQDEGVNPMSGCLWSLLPLPIFFALYAVLREPMTHLMGLSYEQIQKIADVLGVEMTKTGYIQITLAQLVHEKYQLVSQYIPNLIDIDFSFLGLNLAEIPKLAFNWAITIPILSGASAWLAQKVAMKTSGQSAAGDNPAAKQMNSMMALMPLMSVWFGFVMPAAMGVYWIGNSLLGVVQDYYLNKYYSEKFLEDDEKRKALLERRMKAEEDARQEAIRKREQNALIQKQAVAKKQAIAQAAAKNRGGRPKQAGKAAKKGMPGKPDLKNKKDGPDESRPNEEKEIGKDGN